MIGSENNRSSRINQTFVRLAERGEKALIPFITAGDPDLETTCKLVLTLEKNGADIIELGIPFSDPLADGPTIQKASQRSLTGGTTPDKIFDAVERLREKSQVPIVFMVYYNIILQMGEDKFVRKAVSCGVDGIIVPDLPIEESKTLMTCARNNNLNLIFLAAPTSSPERIKRLCSASGGFLYYVSLTGVTGERTNIASNLQEELKRVKAVADKPVCVGFGVSSQEHAKTISQWADGVIVGSALIKLIDSAENTEEALEKAGSFVASLKEVLKG